jgi:phospholipase C
MPASPSLPFTYAPQQHTLEMSAHYGAADGKIKHIIIVIQENRSFNNLFYGYPGARTVKYGYNSVNQKVVLKPIGLETKWDEEHNSSSFLKACNGVGSIPGTDCRMNGFDKEKCNPGPLQGRCPRSKYLAYAYVPRAEVQPYFDMASQYVLADQFFASDFDTSSFIAHQYMITGVNPEDTVDYPVSAWGCPGGPKPYDKIGQLLKFRGFSRTTISPCWDVPTLADELDHAGLLWAFYAVTVKSVGSFPTCGSGPDNRYGRSGIWSAYQAIKHICFGPDWNNVFSPPAQFLVDIQHKPLRAVTWITPTYANSDHGGSGSKTGPSWVTAVVNSVGKSKYWNSSAIFILWDDSGGWYDPQPPAFVDNDGLGFRLPLLIISPYALKGHVSHVPFEFGSILRFVEDQFDLGRLAASDKRAKSPGPCCFDFKQKPRKFVPIKAPLNENYFRMQPEDGRAPDDE